MTILLKIVVSKLLSFCPLITSKTFGFLGTFLVYESEDLWASKKEHQFVVAYGLDMNAVGYIEAVS